MNIQASTPDAQFSSAGDNFHLLWAAKESLKLLNFAPDGLKLLSIESPGKSLGDKIDPKGNLLLGIDLVEFYGSENFKEASRVIISQLKYSTQKPNQNWTFSRLYQGKKTGSYSGSVIHRLATLYDAFASEFGTKEVKRILRIKLISNQPFNPLHLTAISSIQKKIRAQVGPVDFLSLINKKSQYEQAFKKLYTASTLDPFAFSEFFRLLDFEDCGADSRQALEFNLIRSIEKISISPRNPYNALTQLVIKKMNPESMGNPGINLYDLLGTLNFSSIENMFPVPQHFQEPERSIARMQLPNILQQIEEATSVICMHGRAGIGKSVFSQQLQKHLPPYATCLTFDSYGNGAYLDPSDRRHLHRKGLVYLSNVLAKKVGSDFLINDYHPGDIFLLEFKKRIKQAIEMLRAQDPKAFLLLIIDAADNNIHAAQKFEEASFVNDLMDEPLPDGCKLLVTCRTYRRKELHLPDEYLDISIEPFTIEETRKNLLHYFPNSLEQEVAEFHQLSKGVPRVQAYAMDLRKKGVHQVINYLKPHGKKVSDIINIHIKEAGKRIGKHGPSIIREFFTFLINLPRPVPQEFLCELMKVSSEVLEDIASDIWHGLILEVHHFSFRDEDFENYIRQKYSIGQEKKLKIAELFLDKANKDEYAAVNLGFALFEAGKIESLIEVVLENQYREALLDPVRDREVFIERTRLAMKSVDTEIEGLNYNKLLLIAAEEAKTDRALREIMLNNPDLVHQFGEEDSLKRFSQIVEEESWAGTLHMKLAGLYSRNTSTKELAKYHLNTALKWLDWRKNSLPEEELENYPITYTDIVCEAEAIIRLSSPREGYRELCRWRPQKIRIHAGKQLLDELFQHTPYTQLKIWLKEDKLPLLAQVFITVKLWEREYPINTIDHHSICNFLERVQARRIIFKHTVSLILINYYEIILLHRLVDKKRIIKLLQAIPYELPTRIPTLYAASFRNQDSEQAASLALNVLCLQAAIDKKDLNIKDLYPSRFKKIDKEKEYQIRHDLEREQSEFTSFYKPALLTYQLRARWICGILSKKEAMESFVAICKGVDDDWRYKSFTFNVEEQLNFLGRLLTETVMLFENVDKWLVKVLEVFTFQNNEITLRKKILEFLVRKTSAHRWSLQLLYEIEEKVLKKRFSATQATEINIDCARLGGHIDKATGKHFFDKAIEAVEDIDLGAFSQIACIYHLTGSGIGEADSKLAYEYARFIEYADEKLVGYEKKHFPYLPGMEGIYQMDPASLLPILCRWHHRNMLDLTEYLPPLVERMLTDEWLLPEVAASLYFLNSRSYYRESEKLLKIILNQWNYNKDYERLNYFCSHLFREFRIQGDLTYIKLLCKSIPDDSRMDKDLVDEMDRYIDFRESINPEKRSSSYKNDFSLDEFEYPKKLLQIDVGMPGELEKAIESLKEKELRVRDWTIAKYLRDLGRTIPPNQYVTYLQNITRLSPTFIGHYELRDHLKEYLDEWKIHPGVRLWKQESFPRIASLWFKALREERSLLFYLKELAEIFKIESTEFAQVFKQLLPEEISYLDEEVIYESFQILMPLPQDQNKALIKWILTRWTKNLEEDVADGIWNESLTPPSHPMQGVAVTIHFLLGHPDKRIRWDAVHLVRHSLNLQHTELLSILLKRQNDQSIIPFQHADYMFYWLSAKLYLWSAIARISEENPNSLLEFSELFYKELISKELPHVLIRSMIKQTCINLIAADPKCYTSRQKAIIEQQLISQTPRNVSAEEFIEKVISQAPSKYRFSFDQLDTIPYWYQNLGRVFNVGESIVAKVADRIITEEWNYTGDANEDDYIRGQLHSGEYHLTSKRQDNLPTIEDLPTYFEYHAMFCVAQHLLDTLPEADSHDTWTTFSSWLEAREVTWKHYWLSDTRDPLPLEPRYWELEVDEFNEEWRDQVSDSYYDTKVGFEHFSENNRLRVYAQETLYFGEHMETVSIESALVSGKSVEALLRALQTAKDPHDYAIPFEDDVYGNEIHEEGYELKGWLRNTGPEGKGIDKHDPLAGDIGNHYIAFGENVEKELGISYDNFHKHAYLKDKEAAHYQQWSETTDRHYGTVESTGILFNVDVELILEMLRKFDTCLLIRCLVDRQLKDRIYRGERRKKELGNIVKFYLITPNGNVKTLRGSNYQLRKKTD